MNPKFHCKKDRDIFNKWLKEQEVVYGFIEPQQNTPMPEYFVNRWASQDNFYAGYKATHKAKIINIKENK